MLTEDEILSIYKKAYKKLRELPPSGHGLCTIVEQHTPSLDAYLFMFPHLKKDTEKVTGKTWHAGVYMHWLWHPRTIAGKLQRVKILEEIIIMREELHLSKRRFILWDPSDGDVRWNDEGTEILSEGLLGRISLGNAYLTVYPEWLESDHRRPVNLARFQRITGVVYRLSGERGTYDIIRVE